MARQFPRALALDWQNFVTLMKTKQPHYDIHPLSGCCYTEYLQESATQRRGVDFIKCSSPRLQKTELTESYGVYDKGTSQRIAIHTRQIRLSQLHFDMSDVALHCNSGIDWLKELHTWQRSSNISSTRLNNNKLKCPAIWSSKKSHLLPLLCWPVKQNSDILQLSAIIQGQYSNQLCYDIRGV
ncbi:MAG: hypothetical protein GY941_17015 [Planctomycetes bacterium]|nr:hypothetical protein [Planctomycetota bacterium]